MATIAFGEYYHIYNRGNRKQEIFLSTVDYVRFLMALLLFQHPNAKPKLSRVVSKYVQHPMLDIPPMHDRLVELVAFALMPNHFHCIVVEVQEGGIAKYMQRVQISYTKYWNTKREENGHVFQGGYQAVHIVDDTQLTYTSAYIHRNPRELPGWKDREHTYPWSSFQDYASENRWGALLKPQVVTSQVGRADRYRTFVALSGAKERFMDPMLHID
jgi:putative transposase